MEPFFSRCRSVLSPLKLLSTVCLLVVSTTYGAAPALAQGEHGRRVAAEIRVISGDLHRLQSSTTSAIHQSGLMHRIHGGLSALDILLRLADQESGAQITHYANDIQELTHWIDNHDFIKAHSALDKWASQYPLVMPELRSTPQADHSNGKEMHQQLCAGCHDRPNHNVERPAYNLFDEAKYLSTDEFTARLLVGVRGDQVTGIDNPLSDYEIVSLRRFYSQGMERR